MAESLNYDGKKIERDSEAHKMSLRFDQIKIVAEKCLSDTSLTDESLQPTEHDIDKLKEFYKKAAPYFHPKVFPNFLSHSLAVSIGLKIVAKQTKSFNPIEASLDGLMHDLPSIMSPQHYLRKNLLTRPFIKQLGLTNRYQDKTDPIPRILGIGVSPILSLEDMSQEEKLLDLIDNVMKTGHGDRIRSWEEFQTITLDAQRQQKVYGLANSNFLWPSTKFGMKAMYHQGKNQLAGQLVIQEKEWLERTFGLNIQGIINQTQRELDTPNNRRWLLDVRNAQETLDSKVDEKLNRKPIRTVVFDIGGVFLMGNDDQLLTHIANETGANLEKLKSAFTCLVREGMQGEPADFYERLSILTGAKITAKNFELDNFLTPNKKMKKILQSLDRSGTNYVFWTNSFLSRSPIVLKDMEYHFGIHSDKIVVSSQHNLSKYDPDAFSRFATHLGFDLSELVLVDDSETYTTNARVAGMRGFTFRGNPFYGISPFKRLNQELILAGLINVGA